MTYDPALDVWLMFFLREKNIFTYFAIEYNDLRKKTTVAKDAFWLGTRDFFNGAVHLFFFISLFIYLFPLSVLYIYFFFLQLPTKWKIACSFDMTVQNCSLGWDIGLVHQNFTDLYVDSSKILIKPFQWNNIFIFLYFSVYLFIFLKQLLTE